MLQLRDLAPETVTMLDQCEPLTAPEQLDLIRQAQQGSIDARNTLVQTNMRMVAKVARCHPATHHDLDDLIQAGVLGLIRAIEKFDFSKKAAFSTYAWFWIRQSIDRFVNDDCLIRTPHNKAPVTSLQPLGDWDCPTHADPSVAAERNEFLARARRLFSRRMGRLSEREREVIRMRIDGSTLKTVSEEFGVCRERIRQLEHRALQVIFKTNNPPTLAAVINS